MFCENCGQSMDEGSTFCGSCGNKIEPEEPANRIRSTETTERHSERRATIQSSETPPIPPILLNKKTIVIAALALVVAGGVFAWRAMTGQKSEVPEITHHEPKPEPLRVIVPSLIGMSQVRAVSTIKEAGLTVGTITSENHGTVPEGNVISQSLSPGASMASETALNLSVSIGPSLKPTQPAPPTPQTPDTKPPAPQNVTVPNFAGMQEVAAEVTIVQAGLRGGTITRQNHNTVPEGSVISQSLPSGISVARDTVVTLVVSIGPEKPPPPAPTQVILGKDIKAYRLVDTQEFTANNPGKMMGTEYRYGVSTVNNKSTMESTNIRDRNKPGLERVLVDIGSAYYNIGNKYTNMSGLYGPMDIAGSDATATLTIYGDEQILASFEIRAGDSAKQFNLNVAGITQIRFDFSEYFKWYIGLTDHRFVVADVTLSQ